MKWILESNLNDAAYQNLIKSLQRFDLDFEIVNVVSSKNLLLPHLTTITNEVSEKDELFIDSNIDLFPFGTMGLNRIAKERNWKPGSFLNEEFNFEKWSCGFGLENILNPNSEMATIKELIDVPNEFFIRPCEDDKSFTGTAMNKEQFYEWKQNILDNPRNKLNENTFVTVAPLQHILNESRIFIVNGKFVTGSYYRFGNSVRYEEIKDNDPVIDYVNDMINIYQPSKAFVIDIALTEKGYKVIEINNINSAGLYESNIFKFIEAIENIHIL